MITQVLYQAAHMFNVETLTVYSSKFPDPKYTSAGHAGLRAALNEASHLQPYTTSNNEHGLPSFELKSTWGDAYLALGGKQYFAQLLRSSCSALQGNGDLFRVEYTCRMRAETAVELVSAACQVEAEFGIDIRFVALIRGDDRRACDLELRLLSSTLQRGGLVQKYIVGLDVVRNVFELNHVAEGPKVCRELARQYGLDICIDLGESMGRGSQWRTLCTGLDAACAALADGHRVRLRNGMHIKELVEKLRQRDIDIPAGTVSAHLQSPGGDSPEVANRILRLLKSPDAVVEVSLNSNLFLVADTLAERRSTLADFVSWLLQHKLNFFFGYDDPALHEANWLEAGNLCKCHKPWLPEKSKPTCAEQL